MLDKTQRGRAGGQAGAPEKNVAHVVRVLRVRPHAGIAELAAVGGVGLERVFLEVGGGFEEETGAERKEAEAGEDGGGARANGEGNTSSQRVRQPARRGECGRSAWLYGACAGAEEQTEAGEEGGGARTNSQGHTRSEGVRQPENERSVWVECICGS